MRIMSPTVSVILPTYNRAKTLPRAIGSVLAQTYTDYELIIVDDGSTDDTPAVLQPYAARENVRVIFQQNAGAAAARNAGVTAALGRYIAFQDSDDEWLPEKLAVAVSALDGPGSEAGVFYSDMDHHCLDGSTHIYKAPDVKVGVLIDETTLDYAVTGIGIQTAVIRRECFDRYGLFDTALPRFIDLELFMRLALHVPFHHAGKPLVIWNEGPGISSNKAALPVARRYLVQKYRPQLSRQSQHLAAQYLKIAQAYVPLQESRAVCRFAWQAVRTCPTHGPIRRDSLDLLTEFLPAPWNKVLRRVRRLRSASAMRRFSNASKT